MNRYPWLVAASVVALALAGALWWVGSQDRSTDPAAAVAAARTAGFDAAAVGAPPRSMPAVDVLRDWDRARARAYAAADVAGLRTLYVAGSSAGTADVAMLRSYTRRGLRVEGMRMQLLRLEVLRHDPGRWRLRVTDRLHGAVAVNRSGARVLLPRDQASTRVVTLHRVRGSWKVAAVRLPR